MRNKFPGYCLLCHKHVPQGKGHPEKQQGGVWSVRCLACVGKGMPKYKKVNHD